jgi:RimJ/RimL family protein N-acetyltransferase
MYAMPGAPDRPIIRGEHVWLRPLEGADVREHSIDDADLAHFAGFRRGFSAEETERFIQKLAGQPDESLNLSICLLGDTAPIGSCGLRGFDRVNGSAEVAIFLTETSRWGKGLGTDAMNALLDFAFGELRLERVWLRVFDYNERAVRSYEKSGFVREVVLRHDRFHRGAHHDVYLMAIVRPDWEKLDRSRSWDF